MKIDWEKVGGLLPAVVQESLSGEVLMLAYMNEEALNLSLKTGFAHYFSRTKNRIWKNFERFVRRVPAQQVGIGFFMTVFVELDRVWTIKIDLHFVSVLGPDRIRLPGFLAFWINLKIVVTVERQRCPCHHFPLLLSRQLVKLNLRPSRVMCRHRTHRAINRDRTLAAAHGQ